MNSTKVISYNCMYQIYSSLLPCPFTDPKMFWAVPNFLCQTSCGSHKHFVPTKRWFEFSKIVFCVGTKVFEEALNEVKFLGCLKKFGPAQNILGPVKGQCISVSISYAHIFKFRKIQKIFEIKLAWKSESWMKKVVLQEMTLEQIFTPFPQNFPT